MRNAGKLKAGYYPAPREAMVQLAAKLRPPAKGSCAVLDPCAGEGEAILTLISELGLDERKLWMVELDPKRGEKCKQLMPEANTLTPASFISTRTRMGSFSLIYCNPPFDDSAHKGIRVEETFLSKATHLLVEGGVLAFVCPAYVADRPEFQNRILSYYDQMEILEWPTRIRKYNEITLLCRKAEHMISGDKNWWSLKRRFPKEPWILPATKGPSYFEKTGFTDDELLEKLRQSEIMGRIEIARETRLRPPPLSLGVGHLALLLAAGQLDGLIEPPGEPPHVIRGVAQKSQELTEREVDKTKFKVTTKSTYTERIKLIVRAVGPDGIIRTFSDDPPAGISDEPVPDFTTAPSGDQEDEDLSG